MKTTQYWSTGGYLHLTNERGTYAFKATTTEQLEALAAEFKARAEREIRKATLIEAYLTGDAECTPEAIRI